MITAGNSSQITDGAAAMLVMSEEAATRLGLHAAGPVPHVRARRFGPDPDAHRARYRPRPRCSNGQSSRSDDIDRIEINEAFASVVVAWERDVHADLERVNVNGGAIALGHPLGCSGARLTATLLDELERSGGRYGLQTMCEGGGLANAMVIERL